MDLKTLIDNTIVHTLGGQLTDSLATAHRARCLLRAQELIQGIWDYESWEWKTVATQLTATAQQPTQNSNPLSVGVVAMPSNFNIVGDKGGIYVSGQHQKLKWVRPADFMRKKEIFSEVSQFPYWYTIVGQGTTLTPLLYIYPVNTVDTLLDIIYEITRPVLTDLASMLPPTTAPNAALANAAGNLSAGSYTWVVTFVGTVPLGGGGSSPSGETLPGPNTAPTIAVANAAAQGQVNLTNIPLGPSTGGFTTTARKIYRTQANGLLRFLVGTINDNVTTTFTDNVADVSLGVQAPITSSIFSGLEFIPYQYHEAVILRGLIDLMAYDQGDARAATEAKARAVAGAAMMKARRTESGDDVWGMGDEGLNTWGMHIWPWVTMAPALLRLYCGL